MRSIASKDAVPLIARLHPPLSFAPSTYLYHLIIGGLAGMIAKSVVAPVDRIKILFQVSTERFSVSGVVKTMGRIHREEGIAGLWKGNSATMLR